MKLSLCFVSTCFIYGAFFPGSISAAAWTQEKGHGQMILSTTWFQTTKGYDNDGRPQPFGYGGRFRKLDFNPYIEVGLSDKSTVFVNAFVPRLEFRNDFGADRSLGFGDIEFGMRRRLTSRSSRTVISVQSLFSVPAYPESRTPPPGNHQFDFEPRFLVGRGYQLEGASVFWSGEVAYRRRTGAPADQMRFDGTLGANLNRRVMVLGQTFNIKGLRHGDQLRIGSNPNVQSDFDMYKVQGSFVLRVARSTRIQTAVFQTLAGRNTGFSRGYVLSLWQSF